MPLKVFFLLFFLGNALEEAGSAFEGAFLGGGNLQPLYPKNKKTFKCL